MNPDYILYIILILLIMLIVGIFLYKYYTTKSIELPKPLPISVMQPTTEARNTINGTIVAISQKGNDPAFTYGYTTFDKSKQSIQLMGYPNGLTIYSPNKNYNINFNGSNGVLSINKNNNPILQLNNVTKKQKINGIHKFLTTIPDNNNSFTNDFMNNGNWSLLFIDYTTMISMYITTNSVPAASGPWYFLFNIFTNSKTHFPPFTAVIQDDGNFGVYNTKGTLLWSINTDEINPTDMQQYNTNFIPSEIVQKKSLLPMEEEHVLS